MKNYILLLGALATGACNARPNDKVASNELPDPVARVQPAPPAPSTAGAARASSPSAGVVVVPGLSIGPFRLGMSRRDISALGLPTTGNAATFILVSGPYELHLNDRDELDTVSRRLNSDHDGAPNTEPLILGGAGIPASTTFDELRRIVPGCAEPQQNAGATVAACASQTFVLSGLGGVVIQVRMKSPSTTGTGTP